MGEGPSAEEARAGQTEGRGERGDAHAVSDFHVLGVDHVQVTTPEEFADDVVDWYQSCLGLEKIDKPEGTRPMGAWFRAGRHEIHVSVDEHNPPKTAHFGLVVNDFDAVISRLREAKCHIEQASTIPGRRRFYTRDPAGNRIEIVRYDEEIANVMVEESG